MLNDKALKILFFKKVQPEATESFTNESFYDDQLLVIDKLKSLSPVGTKIYIKEHPDESKNDPMARSNFWMSISKNDLFTLSSDENTKDLIDNFDIIATFDGSVGWEAIRNMKPVICFGKPWYLSMPGVFDGSQKLDFDAICNSKWSLNDINLSFTELTKKMGVGYVCDLENGRVNASDEFTAFNYLSKKKKKKDLRIMISFYLNLF